MAKACAWGAVYGVCYGIFRAAAALTWVSNWACERSAANFVKAESKVRP